MFIKISLHVVALRVGRESRDMMLLTSNFKKEEVRLSTGSKKGSGWTGNVRGELSLGKVTEGKGRSKYETENTC